MTVMKNGLTGIWGQIGQMTAVGIIGLLVLMQQRDMNQMTVRTSVEAHDDRKMFIEQIEKLRSDQQTRWEKTNDVHSHAQDQLRADLTRACVLLEKAIEKKP